MDGPVATQARWQLFAIVRDKLGRIVVDEEVFHDPQKLERLRQEVIKDGSNTRNRNP